MNVAIAIDADWLAANPLPEIGHGIDKNMRGRVLVAGGAEFVPGALRLTGEAALRAGAGKLQLATVRAAAIPLGVLVPEAAMIALPADDDGEIAVAAGAPLREYMARCDVLVLGPGMTAGERTKDLVAQVLTNPRPGLSIVLDAAALTCAAGLQQMIAAYEGRIVFTPHHQEMATLLDRELREVDEDPIAMAQYAARRYQAVFVLKSEDSVVAAPDGTTLLYTGGCAGLATGGSGDVLAGIIGGLLARGCKPASAAAWGVWTHAQAGSAAAASIGPLGFLARELLPLIPSILRRGL